MIFTRAFSSGFRAAILTLATLTAAATWSSPAVSQCNPRGALACGDPVTQGAIQVFGECDVYDVTVSASGRILVNLADTGGSSSWSPRWRLLFMGGQIEPVFGGFLPGRETASVPFAGTYQIEVYDSGTPGIGTYTLQMVGISEDLACGSTLHCGADGQVESLDEPYAIRTLTFEVPQSGSVRLTMGNLTGAALAPRWLLFDPLGFQLGTVSSSHALRTCPSAGRYTVLLYDHNGTGTGSVSFSLDGVSDDLSCGMGLACGPQGTVAAFGTQAFGDYADSYRLNVISSGEVTVTATAVGGGASPEWELYDPNGAFVSSRCNGSRVVNLSTSGVHTIVVSDCSLNGDGQYQLTVEPSGTAPAVCGPPVAAALSDNPGGVNPEFYSVSGPPHLGGNMTFSVNGAMGGHLVSGLLARRSEAMIPLGGGQLLLVNPLAAEALHAPLGTPNLNWTATVPASTSLLGLNLYTQAFGALGGAPFALSNRITLSVGP